MTRSTAAEDALSYAFDRDFLLLLGVILIGSGFLWIAVWSATTYRMPPGYQIIFGTLFGLFGITIKFTAVIAILHKLLVDATN